MRISDVLADKGGHVVTVWPDSRLDHVTQLFDQRAIASVVVVDHGGRTLGIFTERELVRAVAKHGAAAIELPVGRVMLTPAPSCRPDDTVGDVLRLMTDNRVRHVLVLRDARWWASSASATSSRSASTMPSWRTACCGRWRWRGSSPSVRLPASSSPATWPLPRDFGSKRITSAQRW